MRTLGRRLGIDWQAIQNSYRTGVPILAVLARIHGIAESTIRARAKRDGWKRDLVNAVWAETRRRLALMPIDAEPLPPPRPLTRAELLELQRADMKECAERWRAWGERRAYRDIDGKVHMLGPSAEA
jgi:hypothetical protein